MLQLLYWDEQAYIRILLSCRDYYGWLVMYKISVKNGLVEQNCGNGIFKNG